MQFKKINIVISDPDSLDAVKLQDQLSNDLYHRFGSDGRNSFQGWSKVDERYVFLIAYLENEPVGCGAIRPFLDEIAELKRMFSLYQGKGIGKAILEALEREAKIVGFKKIWLETRVANQNARDFYIKNGYQQIANYGKYQGVKHAICYEKTLF